MNICQKICFLLMKLPMSGYTRGKILRKLGGVKTYSKDKNCNGHNYHIFVGESVTIDRIHPELIEIGDWTTLATGCVILTHYIDTSEPAPGFKFKTGKVKIGEACFIGANSIICNAVTIGDNSIVAAGSIITKDIPANEIWGGNPARFIKKR